MRRAVVLFVLSLVAGVLLPAEPASAHATAVESSPQANAIVDELPGTVTLRFTEAIDAGLSQVAVTVGEHEVAVEGLGSAAGDPTALDIGLADPDASGVAVLRWRVLSKADGHVTEGILVFGVGDDADPSSVSFESPSAGIDTTDGVLRWLFLAALLLMVGASWFGLVVIDPRSGGPPGAQPDADAEPGLPANVNAGPNVDVGVGGDQRRALTLARAAAGVGVIVLLAMLVAQVVLLAGGLESRSWFGIGSDLLLGSRWGLLWWMRLVGVLGIGILVSQLGTRHRLGNPEDLSGRLLLTLAVVLVIAGQSLGSHGAGLPTGAALSIVADAAHLLSAAVWVGGVATLAAPSRLRWGSLTAPPLDLMDRFGRHALVAASILLASGMVGLGGLATSFDAMLRSTWGRILLAKILVAIVVVCLGAVNSGRFRWNLTGVVGRKASADSERRLRPRTIAAEAAVLTLVVFGAGILTATPTANGPQYAPSDEFGPDTQSFTSDDIVGALSVKPNRPGQNLIAVQAASSRRPAPGEIGKVLLRAESLDDDRGRTSIELQSTGDGSWELLDPVLSSPGAWGLQVVIRRAGLQDEIAVFDWSLSAVDAPDPLISDRRWRVPMVIFAAALLAITIVANLRRRPRVHRTQQARLLTSDRA